MTERDRERPVTCSQRESFADGCPAGWCTGGWMVAYLVEGL